MCFTSLLSCLQVAMAVHTPGYNVYPGGRVALCGVPTWRPGLALPWLWGQSWALVYGASGPWQLCISGAALDYCSPGGCHQRCTPGRNQGIGGSRGVLFPGSSGARNFCSKGSQGLDAVTCCGWGVGFGTYGRGGGGVERLPYYTLTAEGLEEYKLKEIIKQILKKDFKRVSTFIQTPWQAVFAHASSRLQQQTRTQMYLNTTWPQAALCGPIHAKGHLSFRYTCPDSYSCLSVLCVLCVLCLAACPAAVCTMQCWAASNAHYAVLGSFQRVLRSFSRSIYRIYSILRPYLLKLYSIATYLGHQINILDFIRLRQNKNHWKAKN